MHIMESAPGARTVIDGKEVDYFCGCGYFGFQGRRELIEAACQATCKYGLGSATSRRGYGNNPALLDVEKNVDKPSIVGINMKGPDITTTYEADDD